MKPVELKITRIGNSRGVRIPAPTLARYGIEACVVMEERSDGILLRPAGAPKSKLSWDDTAREMAAARESWTAWDVTIDDGLESVPWEAPRRRRVAEPAAEYQSPPRRRK